MDEPPVGDHSHRNAATRLPRGPFGLHWGRGDPGPAPVSPHVPERTSAWLHAVSGPAARAIARGAFDLAARFLARGERVLLLDAAPQLGLHRPFGREARWGVVECLTGAMPVLGLVQDTGRLGLYLLAYGTAAPDVRWSQLGRLLEDARPHFGRAILALEPGAPAAIGKALTGWHLEGWWAGPGSPDRQREEITGRIGIHLHALDLDGIPHATLECLDGRVWTLAAGEGPTAASAAPQAPAAPPEPLREPPVVVCDLHVRERLRFLLWTRRLREGAEGAGGREPSPSLQR